MKWTGKMNETDEYFGMSIVNVRQNRRRNQQPATEKKMAKNHLCKAFTGII